MTPNTTTRTRAHKDGAVQPQQTIEFNARRTLIGQYDTWTVGQLEAFDGR